MPLEQHANCYLCGAQGETRHPGVRDYRSKAGTWTVLRCPRRGCGLLWLHPAPTDPEIADSYRDYYTHTSTASPSFSHRIRQNLTMAHAANRYGYKGKKGTVRKVLMRTLVRAYPGGPRELGREFMYLAAPKAPSLLLDVGCGNGEFIARMKTLGWEVMGVDPDAVAVSQARQKGLTAFSGDLSSVALPDGSVDVITMSHVIEHVRDPLGLLRECLRVLRPGGLLSLVTPNAGSLGAGVFGKSWFALDVPRHLMLFRWRTLGSIVADAGFDIEELASSVTGARSVWSQSLRIRQQGSLKPGARPSFVTFLGGIPFQTVERLLVAVGCDLGEELIVRARKPKVTPFPMRTER